MPSTTLLHIKNMVCPRCIRAVDEALRRCGMEPLRVELGEAEVAGEPAASAIEALEAELTAEGFELLHDPADRLVEDIRRSVRRHAREEFGCRFKLSACLERELGIDYGRISRAFVAAEGRSVETYLMLQRVEYVKELIADRQLTLAEIADKAGFSSAAHLSRIFKQYTGQTPTQYRADGTRRSIDTL